MAIETKLAGTDWAMHSYPGRRNSLEVGIEYFRTAEVSRPASSYAPVQYCSGRNYR